MKVLLLSMLLLISGYSYAQEILGVVTDTKKEPMVSATIIVRQSGIEKARTLTDFDGRYKIKPLDPGYYDVTVSYTGYTTTTYRNVIVLPAGKTGLNFSMEPGPSEPIILTTYQRPFISHGSRNKNAVQSGNNPDDYIAHAPSGYKKQRVNMDRGRVSGLLPVDFIIINITPVAENAPLFVINNVKVKYDPGLYNQHSMLADDDYRKIMFSRMRWSSKYEDHVGLVQLSE